MAIAVDMKWTSKQALKQLNGTAPVVWGTDQVDVRFLNAIPNQDTVEFWSGISGTEVTGTNLPAGGVALTGMVSSVDNATNTAKLDADDVLIADVTASGINAIVLVKDTGNPATSPVLAIGALASTAGSSGGDIEIPWAAGGILTANWAA